ncbi:MAG: M1 family metallopeptidase [Nitrospirota bacterium]
METLIHGRLPGTATPDRYQITLTVNPDEPQFSGSVRIAVTIAKPTSAIMLHALELKIQSAQIEVKGKRLSAKIEKDKPNETIALALSEPIPAGPATLIIDYTGTLNKQLRGLYEGRAVIDGKQERCAFTQCEATDARRIFPCFDEPAAKARFLLTALVPAHLTALSNMPAKTDVVEGKTRRVEFEETPVMSTYLFALAVARLESVSKTIDGCRVSIAATPGQLRYADFAMEVAAASLPRLNDYFGLRYPLAKLDLVALPDFAMGAMENWGAIFFRDSRLLVDSALASTATKRVVANVIVHEIVHQWFGNLVTMRWWDDLWLNESFATWLAVKIVDDWRPEWNSWVEFQQEKQIPLNLDALDSTRPIIAEVTNAAQIEELFDPLTYEKGAAVLRMIEQFLGEERFRDGIRRYIAAHQYGNAPAADLWAALEAASGQPVPAIAQDWFAQAGFPQVAVTSDGRTARIEQQRFRANPGACASPQRWSVPVMLKYADGSGINTHRLLLKEPSATITLSGQGPFAWLYGNAGASGFYRALHAPPLREALRSGALTRLEPAERISLLDDLWAMSQNHTLPIAEFMEALVGFSGDRTRVVVQGLAGYLETLTDQFDPALSRLAAKLFTPLWGHFGWSGQHDDDEARLARAACLWALGRVAKSEALRREALERFEQWLADPASVDPTLATPLARLRATTGDASQFERFITLLKDAPTPEARDRYLVALADFPDPALARRYLELSLTDAVRSQDAWKPLRFLLGQAAHPAVQAEAWRFMITHWKALRDKCGSVGATRMIQGLRHVWRREWEDEVRRFFEEPANRVAAADRALAQTLEFIRIGAAFKERQQRALADWLRRRG